MRHRDSHDDLTSREMEIISLIADGASSGEIGRTLGISRRTVEGHARAIVRKLDAKNRTHAVVIALRNGTIAFPIAKRVAAVLRKVKQKRA
jgi:LuxR family transcriptional regulator, quorum-sensing system regulator SdiA